MSILDDKGHLKGNLIQGSIIDLSVIILLCGWCCLNWSWGIESQRGENYRQAVRIEEQQKGYVKRQQEEKGHEGNPQFKYILTDRLAYPSY